MKSGLLFATEAAGKAADQQVDTLPCCCRFACIVHTANQLLNSFGLIKDMFFVTVPCHGCFCSAKQYMCNNCSIFVDRRLRKLRTRAIFVAKANLRGTRPRALTNLGRGKRRRRDACAVQRCRRSVRAPESAPTFLSLCGVLCGETLQ